MKIKYLLWISLITTITWSISLSAQSPVFSVMVAEGSIKLRQSQSDSIIDMRHGMELHLQDIITLHDNAYLGMVHINSGRTVAFKNPRTIYISDLSKELGEQTMLSKVMSNLVEFFRESKSSFADIVHVSAIRGPVQLFLPPSCKVWSQQQTIHWRHSKDSVTYVLSAHNALENELFAKETSQNHFTLHMDEEALLGTSPVFLSVQVKGKPETISRTCSLIRIKGQKFTDLRKEVVEIEKVLDLETAMGNLQLAMFYEQKSLLVDAGTFYQEAINLEPDVSVYQKYYDAFIVEHRLHE